MNSAPAAEEPAAAAARGARPPLTAASSAASIDDSTVSLAGTDRADGADLEQLSDEEEDEAAAVVAGSLQFALNEPEAPIRASAQPASAVGAGAGGDGADVVADADAVAVAVADTEHELGQELDEPAAVYTGRPGDPELPEGIDKDTVTVLTNEYGCKAWLIGTAHFSKKSQEDVAKLIRFVRPECVMLELCRSRVNILHMDESNIEEELKALNFERVLEILRQSGVVEGCLYLLMLNLSAHLTRELGMAPGGEFRTAYQEARQLPGCEVRLGDRPIHITIERALASLNAWKKLRLAYNLLTSKGSITKEEVERCKQKEMLEEMLEEMAGDFPGLGEVFVNERDVFLCASLADATRVVPCNTLSGWRPSRTVGVVGIGHVPGMIRNWGKVDHRDQAALMRVAPPSLLGRAVRITVRLTIWGLVAYCVYRVAPVPRKEAWVTGLRDGISQQRHGREGHSSAALQRRQLAGGRARPPPFVAMNDEYFHEDARLFYTAENCPGLGCDRALFDVQLCNALCACGAECARRVVQRGPRAGLEVFDAGRRGLGLRSRLAIAAGEFVCCYAGEVVGAAEAARRFATQPPAAHNYILAVREHCAGRLTVTYIDATRACNVGHYANHSCRPNLALRPVRVDSPVPHAALFAARPVRPGEELTFSYGEAAAAAAGRACLCGERECRGWLPSQAVTEEEEGAGGEARPQRAGGPVHGEQL
ncbi:uncharacterized protein LOC119110088 [Pollicipes pollicipes]|uniref:uncharacterized protein LOC119110088 n=1 Tax=Pollicipes pollicipes TaxID=41117 RepID=UPI001885A2AB|nr:uncharacterized protein LOC119110088 [Pollicipes pollicipes]